MLTAEEREKIRGAVVEAEKRLAAEIVPCLYAQSSPYPETIWAGAAAAIAVGSGLLFLVDLRSPIWLPLSTLILFVPAAGILGAAAGKWISPLKRLFIGSHRMEDSVSRRAKEVFFDRGLDRTKARDGVLIFVSALERKVVVLADRAVSDKIKPEMWAPVVKAVTSAEGRLADGLIAAIEQAAKVLTDAGLSGRGGGELDEGPIVDDGK
jgi:putative membrane protein